ncbi:MAG TPA: hypothetical protein PK677_17715 [Acidiphilium sp.]|nr:hypothetical protein [Acidiphilium sp.]
MRVGLKKTHLREATAAKFRQFQERCSDIDTDNSPSCANSLSQLDGGLSRTTSDIDYRVAYFRLKDVDPADPKRG